MSNSSDLILMTGASGFIGIKTLHRALQAGYSVRAAVRSEEELQTILSTPLIRSLDPGLRLTFVKVPDITAANAYNEAVKGVKYIVHMASTTPKSNASFPPDQREAAFIQPALRGTTGILEAALKAPNIKRLVITSSILAIIPFAEFFATDTETVYNAKSRYSELPVGPYNNDLVAYTAGKARALHEAETFVAKHKPAWDVVYIMPGWVVGRHELGTKVEDLMVHTNAPALNPVLGHDDNWKVSATGRSVHVSDVAELHVRALDPKIPGNESYIAVSGGEKGTVWEESFDIVKRNFPEAVAKGLLPCNVPVQTKHLKVDASRTEKIFGIKFASYEEQVKSIVGQYLQLVGFGS